MRAGKKGRGGSGIRRTDADPQRGKNRIIKMARKKKNEGVELVLHQTDGKKVWRPNQKESLNMRRGWTAGGPAENEGTG